MIRSTMATCLVLVTLSACGGPFRFGPPLPPGMEALGAATSETTSDDAASAARDRTTAKPESGGLTVQGEVLAVDEVWRDQIPELRRRARAAPPAEFRRWVAQQSAALIADRIAESLLYQKASAQIGSEAEPSILKYIDGEIRKVVTEQFDGIQRRYEKSLEQDGRSLEDVRRQLRRQAIIGAYLESDVRSRIPEPTRAELSEAFERERNTMRRPGRRSMSLIDIRISQFIPATLESPTRAQSGEARESARAEALSALRELRSGTPFADVARRRSHGLRAVDGGKWGWIAEEAVRERFRPAVKAMANLSPGQVSELIEVPDGFFIVSCDSVEEAYEPDFVTAQPILHRRIVNQRYNRAIGAEIERLRSLAGIDEATLSAFHNRVVKTVVEAVEGDRP